MKNNIIIDSWNKIDPDAAVQKRMLNNILVRAHEGDRFSEKADDNTSSKKKSYWKIIAPVAACLVIVVVAVLSQNGGVDVGGSISGIGIGSGDDIGNGDSISSDGIFVLERSHGVTVSLTVDEPSVQAEADLMWLTEEELFAPEWEGLEIAAFEGTIKDVKNIVISFGEEWHEQNYRAIAYIEVGEVYRGGIEPGSLLAVLLPGPVDMDSMQTEDTETSRQMTTGVRGIFMPVKYNEESVWIEGSQENALYMLDIAEYGLLDGVRWAFLDKPEGPIFERNAYEGISDASTMEEVRQYVISMLIKAQSGAS